MVEAKRCLFRFEDVSLSFGAIEVLDRVSFAVNDEVVTVIAGPSGAGKSTLLRLCNRLEVPTSGVVSFREQDVASMDPLTLRRRVGMVFQRPTLFGGTVRDNLVVAEPTDDARYRAVLERVGLEPAFLGRQADDLSGGEAQRACLARTLLTQPEVLLMDEPTSALDPSATRLLERLATDLAHDGIGVLWVSHDLEQVARIADERIVLLAGRVADPTAAGLYLAGHDANEGGTSDRRASGRDRAEGETGC